MIEVVASGSRCGAFTVSGTEESPGEDEDDDDEFKPSIEINLTQSSSSASGVGEVGASCLWDEDRIHAKARDKLDCLAAFTEASIRHRELFEEPIQMPLTWKRLHTCIMLHLAIPSDDIFYL
jgi:hypothetical protein